MTEKAFQAGRKIMQTANYWRGMITTAKGNVAKWTKIEDVHRRELRQSQADGAKKMLDKAMKRLDETRQKFASIMFPDNDLQEVINRCGECGCRIAEGNHYCGECLCENDCDY